MRNKLIQYRSQISIAILAYLVISLSLFLSSKSVQAEPFGFGPLAPNSEILWNRYVIPAPLTGENIQHESDLFIPDNLSGTATWDLYVDDLGVYTRLTGGLLYSSGSHIITVDLLHNRQPGDRKYKIEATYYDESYNRFTKAVIAFVPEQ